MNLETHVSVRCGMHWQMKKILDVMVSFCETTYDYIWLGFGNLKNLASSISDSEIGGRIQSYTSA